jgi:hypothetical protein
MSRLICLFIGHSRSRRHARFDGYTFVSACKRCGRPMHKDNDDRWRSGESPFGPVEE